MGEIGDVLIQCPYPGQEEQPAMRLGDFMDTELGQRVLGSSIKNVELLTGTGMGEEQALTIALGAAAVRDEEGALVRRTIEEQSSLTEPTPELAEFKKK